MLDAREGFMNKFLHFVAIYKLYRAHNPRKHALTAAWRIAVTGLPF